MEVSGQRHIPAALPPGNKPGTRSTEARVRSRNGYGVFGELKKNPFALSRLKAKTPVTIKTPIVTANGTPTPS